MNLKPPTITNSCTVNYDEECCFEELTDDENKLIEENSVLVEYKKGETVCKQGTYASHVMLIKKGLIKMYIESNNNSLTLRILPKGNMIGLTPLFEGNNVFQYSAVTYQASTIRLIDVNIFKQIIQQNAKFSIKIINILCGNIIQTNGRFFSITNKQSFGRLADLIICLSLRIYKSDTFELLLSRKELAELSGLSTESVIRIIKKFKDDKLISVEGKKITIINKDKLQDISNYG